MYRGVQRRIERGRQRWPWTGLAALLLGVAAACSGTLPWVDKPVVRQQQKLSASHEALRKIAVMPFYPAESLGDSAAPRSAVPVPGQPGATIEASGAGQEKVLSRWEVAAHVSNFMASALAERGISVVTPNDVELAFTGAGRPVPRLDPRLAAELSSTSFDASGVLLGRALRYRERGGGAGGATSPASVAFTVSLHDVPSGRRLWSGRFDETQKSLTADVFRARQYPGGGTRWLSASEFARWGASQVATSLVGP